MIFSQLSGLFCGDLVFESPIIYWQHTVLWYLMIALSILSTLTLAYMVYWHNKTHQKLNPVVFTSVLIVELISLSLLLGIIGTILFVVALLLSPLYARYIPKSS